MRTNGPILRRVRAVFVPGILAIAFAPLGCDTTQQMISDSDAPASQGTVTVGAAGNGNTDVTVRVRHLAPPSRLASDAKIYVVWIQATDGAKQNVGALTLNDNLEGHLGTVTPHQRFLLTVTPEPSGQVAAPTHDPVFTSWVERK